MPRGRRNLRALALPGTVSVLILLLAVVLPRGFALAQRTVSAPMVLPDTPVAADYLELMLAGLIAMGALVTVLVAVSAERAGDTPRARRTPLWAQMAMIAFAVLVAVGLSRAGGVLVRGGLAGRGGGSENVRLPEHALPHTMSHALGIAVTVGLALATVALIAGAYLLLRRDRSIARERGEFEDELRAAVAEGLDRLESTAEPRAAIVACYAAMQRIVAASGVPRRASDTPFELLARVLRERSEVGPGADRLTVLFERAKFSDHPITEAMRREAIEALESIEAGLQPYLEGEPVR